MRSIWEMSWSLLPLFMSLLMSAMAMPTSRFITTMQNRSVNMLMNIKEVPDDMKQISNNKKANFHTEYRYILIIHNTPPSFNS